MVPLIVVGSMTRYFGPKRSWWDGLALWKFALFAAFAMTIPYVATAYFFGPEFPTLVGSLVGLAMVTTAAKRRWFLSRDEEPWDFEDESTWPREWTGSRIISSSESVESVESTDRNTASRVPSLFMAWLPYLIVAGLLLATRLWPAFKAMLQSYSIEWPKMLGSNVNLDKITLLYSPGTIFILTSIAASLMYRLPIAKTALAWRRSSRVLLSASFALLCAVPMVQVIIHTDDGAALYPKMPIALAEGVAQGVGRFWPLFASVIGGLGAFVAGSNTVSNMMFSLFQFNVSQRIDVDPILGVALQAVGGAAGNMICVHNVVAACAVVGLNGREGWVLRRTVVPFLYYALFAGLLGMIWSFAR